MRNALRAFRSRISYKIVVPYLALTLIVMLIGAAISVGLVAASVEERIQSQLTQSARNTSDALVRRERNYLEFLRLVSLAGASQTLPSVAEAFTLDDRRSLEQLLLTYYQFGTNRAEVDFDRLIAFDSDGATLFDFQRVSDEPEAAPIRIEGLDISQVPFVQQTINNVQINGNDKFSGLIIFAPDPQPQFYTTVPVRFQGRTVGGIMISSKTDRLLAAIERNNEALVTTFYDLNGQATSSTLLPRSELGALQMSSEALTALRSNEAQSIFTVLLRQREYGLVYSPLAIADQQVGYFSVGLARDFQVQDLSTSRGAIIVITLVLAVGSVLLGYRIAREITRPLNSLVETAEAVTSGDLDRRTLINSNDEFGTLATAFNEMTERLLALYRTSRDLNRSIVVDDVLAVTTETVNQLAPETRVFALANDDYGVRYLKSAKILLPGSLERVLLAVDAPVLHTLGALRERGTSLNTEDAPFDELGLAAAGFARAMITPIVVQGTTVGALIFASASETAFNERNTDALGAVGNMSASVLYNAVLFDRVQNEASERQAILQSIADGVIVCDPEQHILLMNETAEHMLGDVTAHNGRLRLDDLPLIRVEASSDLLVTSGTDIEHYQIGQRTVSLTRAPVRGDDGNSLGQVVVMRDISGEIELDRAKTNFIGTISHELRSPLTVITGYVDIILRGLVGEISDEQRTYLEQVRAKADVITAIARNAAHVALLDSGKFEFEPTALSPASVVSYAVDPLRRQFNQRKIDLQVALDTALPDVLADRESINIALTNVLDNALRYTGSGSVHVQVTSEDDEIVFAVRDTGPGIPPEEFPRLFTRIHRIKGNDSVERGSGLGLAIARQIIERHNGRIWAESTLGTGSVFRIALPVAQ